MKLKMLGVICVVVTGIALSAWIALWVSEVEAVEVKFHEPVANQYGLDMGHSTPISIGQMFGRTHP